MTAVKVLGDGDEGNRGRKVRNVQVNGENYRKKALQELFS